MENREIKFRVWHKERAKWLNMDEVYITNNKAFFFDDNGACGDPECCGEKECYMSEYNDVDIVQFTGLKDKGGKEIYEGDIIEWDCTPMREDKKTVNCIVEITPENGVLPNINTTSRIIGNIYENPELINN